jgi:prepilin-type N-terminal cleavage/methylation domain-containing protein
MKKNKKGFTQHLWLGQKRSIIPISKKGAGFTLVELLVVISIIGILSSLATASVNIARKKARDAKRKADISQVQLALYLYYDDNSKFPEADMLPENAIENWQDILAPNLDSTITGKLYMLRPPVDPLNISPYFYGYNSDGQEFILSYYLEDEGAKEIHGY